MSRGSDNDPPRTLRDTASFIAEISRINMTFRVINKKFLKNKIQVIII